MQGGATYATVYLNDVEQVLGADDDNKVMSYEIAKVEVGDVAGFPMDFTNMVPETVYDKTAHIKYEGTTPGDLYFKATFIGNYADLSPYLQVKIAKVDGNGSVLSWVTPNWESATTLYSWKELDHDVVPGATVNYKVYAKVLGLAGINDFQGKIAYNGVAIQAVQANGTPAE